MRPAAAQAAEWWQGAVLITFKIMMWSKLSLGILSHNFKSSCPQDQKILWKMSEGIHTHTQ
jgi:hypothetical protein